LLVKGINCPEVNSRPYMTRQFSNAPDLLNHDGIGGDRGAGSTLTFPLGAWKHFHFNHKRCGYVPLTPTKRLDYVLVGARE